MMPLPNRWLSSVLLRYQAHLILFDCGEGTQISLRALGWGLKGIDAILISHLHGDHVGGLPGLLLTVGHSGRTDPVKIIGPPGLTQTVAALRVIAPHLPFAVHCVELDPGATCSVAGLRLEVERADHSVPCLAFRLTLNRQPRFDPDQARLLNIPQGLWGQLQAGQPVEWAGDRVEPSAVLGPPRRGLSVAYVTDTRPTPALSRLAHDVDLLICEGMYGNDEDRDRAAERKHLTFSEAARLARSADAKRLLLTHFSPSVPDPAAWIGLARAVFPATEVAFDHLSVSLAFPRA